MGIMNFLFGGKTKQSEQKSNTTQTINTGPYQPAQPYINDYLSANRDLYSNTPQFSPEEMQGYDYLKSSIAQNNGDPNAAQQSGLMGLIANAGGSGTSEQGLMQLIRASRANPTARNGMSMLYDAVNGPGVANPVSANGLGEINNVNGGPSGYTDAAEATLGKTAAGDYLTPDTNPYLADIASRISGIAGSQMQGMFGGRGRSGSGLSGYYGGKAVGDSLTDMYGQVYESERGRQQQAAMGAPGFDATKANTAMSVGTGKLNAGMGFGKALDDQNLGHATTLFNAGNAQQDQALKAGSTLFDAGNTATTMGRTGAQGVFDAGTALQGQKTNTGMQNAQALISAGQNISARPYDISGQYGNILANIGKLGTQGTTTGTADQVNYGTKPGLIGGIFNSFVNKLFGTTMNTGS